MRHGADQSASLCSTIAFAAVTIGRGITDSQTRKVETDSNGYEQNTPDTWSPGSLANTLPACYHAAFTVAESLVGGSGAAVWIVANAAAGISQTDRGEAHIAD